MNSVVYVDSEQFNLVEEFGQEYLDSYDGSDGMIGILLKNRIKLIFASGSKVIFNYTGANEKVHTYFSPFNSGKYGFTLENAYVESTNCRYSCHDERNIDEDAYRNIYKNCTFIHDSSNCSWGTHQAIGGGLGKNGEIVIDGGYFENKGASELEDLNDAFYSVSYHNSAASDAQSSIHIKNAYLSTSALIMRGGTTEKQTKMTVNGCSVSKLPQAFNYDQTPKNVIIEEWGNTVRV